MLELLLSGWYKLNFDGSIRKDRAVAGFVVRSDTGILVGVDSFSVIILLMSEMEIRDL